MTGAENSLPGGNCQCDKEKHVHGEEFVPTKGEMGPTQRYLLYKLNSP